MLTILKYKSHGFYNIQKMYKHDAHLSNSKIVFSPQNEKRSVGFLFRVMKMFGNYLEVLFTQQWDSTNATEFFTLNWLILCHMNFTSI